MGVVEYSEGNPLILRVLGSSLRLKNKINWENILNDLSWICTSDSCDMLKINFNELTPQEKSRFLDIACFLDGEDKDFGTRIPDDSMSYGLDVIIDESPIIISHIRLLMHDLLQEMEPDIYSLQ